jgi:hypothetical protein
MFQFFLKKYYDVGNVAHYHSINFQNEIRCILGSLKMTQSHKKTKSSFICTVHRGKISIYLFSETIIQHILF